MIIFAYFFGGLFAVYLFYAIWESVLFMRILDDPVKGKMAAVFSGYVTASLLSILVLSADPKIFLYYLLPATIIATFAYRRGTKLREQPEARKRQSYAERPQTIIWFERAVFSLATFTAGISIMSVISPYWREPMSPGYIINNQIYQGNIIANYIIAFFVPVIMIVSAFIVSWGQSKIVMFCAQGLYSLAAGKSIIDFLESLFGTPTLIEISVNLIRMMALCIISSLLFSKTSRRWISGEQSDWDESNSTPDDVLERHA